MTTPLRELLESETSYLTLRGQAGPARVRLLGAERAVGALAEHLGVEPKPGSPVAAELDLMVIDAARGLFGEARRRGVVSALLGAERLVVVVDGMDGVEFSQARFAAVENDCRRLASDLGVAGVECVPACLAEGDNVRERSPKMPWYAGLTLAESLQGAADLGARARTRPFRLLVESTGSRAVSGIVIAGELNRGDVVRAQRSGRSSRVMSIRAADTELEGAGTGAQVTLELDDTVEATPGELLARADQPVQIADQFEATIVWTAAAPLLRGRSYRLELARQTASATIAPLKYKLNVDSLEHVAAAQLETGEIGVCGLQLDRPIAFDPYRECPATGGFVLVDPLTNQTAGGGMLHFALRRAQNVHWQAVDVNKTARAELKRQRPCVLWYTGLSGAGKSTIANLVDKKLYAMNRHSYLLDGDNVRHGLNKDLGFTAADRVENIRRIAEVAKLMVDAGLIVGTAFISPFRAERQMARALLAPSEFVEIFVDTPLAVAEERDPKGLYKKARRGDLKNFTGIDSPYEPPENPEIRIDTTLTAPEAAADLVVSFLVARGAIVADSS